MAHVDSLYRYAISLTRNSADAEDLVQETYCRAMRACTQLPPHSNLKSWIFAILRNTWLNQVRHDRSGPAFSGIDGDAESGPATEIAAGEDPYAVYVHRLERDAVREAVRCLPVTFREIIMLREFEGLSYQEIGDILQLAPGTVMSRLNRARDRLRLALSEWGQSRSSPN